MKHIAIILLTWMSAANHAGSDFYVCKDAKLSIFSSAPIETISAETSSGTSVYNPGTGEFLFSINIRSLAFEKALMQEHFNTDYLESDKFPKATFKGKIQELIDVNKNGTFPVTAVGELEVHGIKQARTIQGSVSVNNGIVSVTSEFMVKCMDHHIEIPAIVFHNIAQSIRINIAATYTRYKTP